MTEKEMAGRNMIIKVASGSHLYGTNTPESDLDYLGIFIPEEKYILGLSSIEQVDLSIIDKAQSGKNTKKAIDFVVYELRKFVNLALQNNPNILEILCVKPESTEYITEYGITLLELRDKIVSQLLIDRFYKYSLSQKKKMFLTLPSNKLRGFLGVKTG
jgi:uncharacterized protein